MAFTVTQGVGRRWEAIKVMCVEPASRFRRVRRRMTLG
jgi:hypothetical protein